MIDGVLIDSRKLLDRAKEDEQFAEEKNFLVQQIQALSMP